MERLGPCLRCLLWRFEDVLAGSDGGGGGANEKGGSGDLHGDTIKLCLVVKDI